MFLYLISKFRHAQNAKTQLTKAQPNKKGTQVNSDKILRKVQSLACAQGNSVDII